MLGGLIEWLSLDSESVIEGVVFDLDGIVIQSEELWDSARRELISKVGGRWTPAAQKEMMGMSPSFWPRYMHESLGVPLEPEEISRWVLDNLAGQYRRALPLIPGAVDAIRSLRQYWPLAVASSSDRELINLVLDLADVQDYFLATVSSGEVAHGKPAPDVYLAACAELKVNPQQAVAIEDSNSGIQSALKASMKVIAIPNSSFPPQAEVLARAHRVLPSIRELSPAILGALEAD